MMATTGAEDMRSMELSLGWDFVPFEETRESKGRMASSLEDGSGGEIERPETPETPDSPFVGGYVALSLDDVQSPQKTSKGWTYGISSKLKKKFKKTKAKESQESRESDEVR